jgi:predicted amidohydrolase
MLEGVERGADIIFTPEFCTGAAAVWNLSPPGKALQWFLDFANEHHTYVAASSYIRDEKRTNMMPLCYQWVRRSCRILGQEAPLSYRLQPW